MSKADNEVIDSSKSEFSPTEEKTSIAPESKNDVLENRSLVDEEIPFYSGDAGEHNTGSESLVKSDIVRRSSSISFDENPKPKSCHSFIAEWPKERKMLAILGSLSSTIVLIVRLKIDPGYLTYTIHSIIVFFDMVLIHLFTATKWLSISGEGITVVSVLLYHYTKQKVWELLETTLLAMICSFHMISLRSAHWDREEELEGLIGLEIIANHDDNDNITAIRRRSAKVDKQTAVDEHTNITVEADSDIRKEKLQRCSRHFFEHFLDGSAGVMYTSFLGLIIDEFIVWGTASSFDEHH